MVLAQDQRQLVGVARHRPVPEVRAPLPNHAQRRRRNASPNARFDDPRRADAIPAAPCAPHRLARRFTCLTPRPRRSAASRCFGRLSATAVIQW